MVNMGVAYKSLGRREDALQYYHQALSITPDDPEVINNIGSLNYALGQYEKAVEYFLRALEIKPNGIFALSTYDYKHRCRVVVQFGLRID